MDNQRQSNLRMGGKPKSQSKKTLVMGAVAAVFVLVLAVIVLTVSSSEDEVVEKVGCQSDSQCQGGRVCAGGGCIILISKQYAGLWHDDLKAQADAGVEWQPRAAFGEKLFASDKCPAKSSAVDKPPFGQTFAAAEVTVHEVRSTEMFTHKYSRFKGSVWIDSVRFWFPGLKKLGAKDVCSSDPVAEVAVGTGPRAGKQTWFVDAALTQTVPVGAESKSAVAVRRDLELPDDQGVRTLSFPLPAAFGDDLRLHTVAAFPLGSDIEAITGPPPTQQRLLNGYIVYYWEHKPKVSNVMVRFKVKEGDHRSLDLTTVNP